MVNKTVISEEKLPFEDLEVWKEAVNFAEECLDVIDKIETDRKHYRLIEQAESASASPSLNIAEGKGRFSKKEFVQFLYISRGSLFEAITLMEIFRRRKWIEGSDFFALKKKAVRLSKRINSLINSLKNR